MDLLRYVLSPRGPFATQLRSDTLHGHLICAAAELDGRDAAGALLARFEGAEPPFVCASALPSGFLPMPCLPPLPRKAFKERYATKDGPFKGSLFEALNACKRFRKKRYLPLSLWPRLRNRLSLAALFGQWTQDPAAFEPALPPRWRDWRREHAETRNSIDRMTGTVPDEGGLYLSEATFYYPGVTLDLYVRTAEPDLFERLLGHLASTGFGRDRSTGKGCFTFERDANFDPATLDGAGEQRLSLSVVSAMDMSTLRGWYATFTKHGKAWDGFGESRPFKKPFLALEEGAVYESLPASGYLLRGLHPDPAIVQILWPLTIPLTLDPTEVRP